MPAVDRYDFKPQWI